LSPVEPYCRACGTAVRRNAEITLEPTTSHADRAAAPVESPSRVSRFETAHRWPHGWPVVTGVTLVVAIVALGLTLQGGGSRGGDAADRVPVTQSPVAASTTVAAAGSASAPATPGPTGRAPVTQPVPSRPF